VSAPVEIIGVGIHPFGRFPGLTLKDLARVAVVRALDDAGVGTHSIDAVYSANAMAGVLQGQEQIRGQSVLREVGIERVPIVNVENACASGSTALREAVMGIRAGAVEVALVLGFEKMFVDDLDRSLAALETAADLDVVGGLGLQFTAVYAMRVKRAIERGAITRRHLAEVTVKSHANAALNPNAQHRRRVSADEVEASRMIAEPLTLMMCSSICDGAAAAVVAAPARLESRCRVVIRASAGASGFTRLNDDEPTLAANCARAAYDEAGLGPHDVDVAEVHDAVAPGELLYYEQLGLCGASGAGAFFDSGATWLDGALPVNPSGGLSSRGHPTGATGLAQIAELVWQLRGEAGARQAGQPRVALAQNSGGWYEGDSAACNVHILERLAPWN
jgi:acetyl-CoA acetyltransferase